MKIRMWEVAHAVVHSDAEQQMPLAVIVIGECANLIVALTEAELEGDIGYFYALPTDGELADVVPPFVGAVEMSIGAISKAGLVFVAVDPLVEGDLAAAYAASQAMREAGLFVVALIVQTTGPSNDVKTRVEAHLSLFDSVIPLQAAWPDAQTLACKVIGHLAGGLKIAPPVCTDLADAQGILRGAVVSVGVGESMESASAARSGLASDAATRAISDARCSNISTATGVIIAITGYRSIALNEISRVTHQVGELVESDSAPVIPMVHIVSSASYRFRVLVLAAHCSRISSPVAVPSAGTFCAKATSHPPASPIAPAAMSSSTRSHRMRQYLRLTRQRFGRQPTPFATPFISRRPTID